MGKYAVLVGVNYTANPEAALKGCVNDTHISKAILLSKGFSEDNIRMLNDEGGEDPSGVNVKKALQWLCSDRSSDDYIFFHFSGHGTQVPSDGDDHEEDNKDEALCCAGLFLLADDDFKQFFTMCAFALWLTPFQFCLISFVFVVITSLYFTCQLTYSVPALLRFSSFLRFPFNSAGRLPGNCSCT